MCSPIVINIVSLVLIPVSSAWLRILVQLPLQGEVQINVFDTCGITIRFIFTRTSLVQDWLQHDRGGG